MNYAMFTEKKPVHLDGFLSYLWVTAPTIYATISLKEAVYMAEYELVREIPNLCPNNQMRDIFFDEVETDDPAAYVRTFLKDSQLELTVEDKGNGAVTVYAVADGMTQKFIFTPI